jgi:voltage-gated potassium channel
MNSTMFEYVKAKELGQREIDVDEIRRRSKRWRLTDCDEEALESMRHALIEEMEEVEGRLVDTDRRFMHYVQEGRPLDTQRTLQVIDRFSVQWERLNAHLKAVNEALLERSLRNRLIRRLGSERNVNLLDGAIFSLIVVALGLLLVELLFPLPKETISLITTVDTIICFFLIGDWVLRMSLSEDKGWYFRRYWIDLISSIPVLEALRIGRLVRITRFARLFRLLRLGRALRVLLFAFRGIDKLFQTFQMNLLKRSVLIASVLLLFGALSISSLEKEERSLQEVEESLWWSFTTVVTGGFADLYNPSTTTGRIVTGGLVLLGFAVTGIFTASLTSVLVEDDSSRIEHSQRNLKAQLDSVEKNLRLLSTDTNRALIVMETVAQPLANQASRQGVAQVLAETMVQEFECIQASVHLLDPDTRQLLRLALEGPTQEEAAPARCGLDTDLIGRVAAGLLEVPDITQIDLEPVTEMCVTVKGTVMACPMVAGQKVIGVLRVILPEDMARYYLYNRVPMTLAHHAALAIHAADLADSHDSVTEL